MSPRPDASPRMPVAEPPTQFIKFTPMGPPEYCPHLSVSSFVLDSFEDSNPDFGVGDDGLWYDMKITLDGGTINVVLRNEQSFQLKLPDGYSAVEVPPQLVKFAEGFETEVVGPGGFPLIVVRTEHVATINAHVAQFKSIPRLDDLLRL